MSSTTMVETSEWIPSTPKRGWSPQDISLKDLTHVWTARERAALRELVVGLQAEAVPCQLVTRSRFSHPDLDDRLSQLRRDLRQGPGLLFLGGVERDEYSIEELRLLFAGVGSHFGVAVSQSKHGDTMGEVTEQRDRAASKRGYVVAKALPFHTDSAETFGLFCVQPAKEGGENVFVSSLKLYEVIQREHPQFIPILERGFRMWLNDEQQPGRPGVTPHRVPVFGAREGLRSCLMAIELAEPTGEAIGEPLSEEERAAVACVLETRDRPELGFVARLDAGEAVFVNNFEILHSRKPFEAFENPPRPRHLLRLWLQDSPSRPLPPEYPLHRFHNPSGAQGIDPVPPALLQEQIRLSAEDPVSRAMMEALKAYG